MRHASQTFPETPVWHTAITPDTANYQYHVSGRNSECTVKHAITNFQYLEVGTFIIVILQLSNT